MSTPSDDLTFAVDLAKQCATIFKKYYGNSTADWKADNTPVTLADMEINDLCIRSISAAYPTDSIYGEEASSHTDSKRVWAIDPVDGTQAFDNAIPLSTIVIALIESGNVKLAVAYEPISDTLYSAEKCQGAFKNGRPIHCDTNDAVRQSYFATSSRMPETHATAGQIHDRIEAEGGKDYNFRSFTYCAMRVADGTFSGSVLGLGRLFDTAAAALIVEEAGGKATDLDGKPLNYTEGSNGIIVTNGPLHSQFVAFAAQ